MCVTSEVRYFSALMLIAYVMKCTFSVLKTTTSAHHELLNFDIGTG